MSAYYVALTSVIILASALRFLGIYLTARPFPPSKPEKALKPKGPPSPKSFICRSILASYDKLPTESRLMGDITPVLLALEVEHESALLDAHFSWDGIRMHRYCVRGRPCPFQNVVDIEQAIDDLAAAHREKEKQIQLAAVSHDLAVANSLAERLMEEAALIRTVTKEITH